MATSLQPCLRRLTNCCLPQGIETRVPGFGTFDAIPAAYRYAFTDNFTQVGVVIAAVRACIVAVSPTPAPAASQLGWEVGKNLFMAPFDWRVPSFNQTEFHARLQALVEEVHASTGQKVSFFALSEGPQVTLSFLHRMPQAWKDEHVAWFAATSPVWSGSPMYGLGGAGPTPLWLAGWLAGARRLTFIPLQEPAVVRLGHQHDGRHDVCAGPRAIVRSLTWGILLFLPCAP